MLENEKQQLPRFRRAKNPPAMRLQVRDLAILQTIQDFDGFMTRRHIKKLFWPQSSVQAMEARLSKLYHNGYLDWPDADQRRLRPIPEPLIWLGWKGILALTRNQGLAIDLPSKTNENHLRLLQKRLHKAGIRWVREPNWNQPAHEIAVADFRIALLEALDEVPNLELEQWIPESTFRAEPDTIQFKYNARGGIQRKRAKGVVPDGFFVISNLERKNLGKPHRALFLLEVDQATHDNTSFGIEKAAAGAAYIGSKEYKQRFGSEAGRWLVITTGETRLQNLLNQTIAHASKRSELFFFTTLEKATSRDMLTKNIWHQPGSGNAISLPLRTGE